MSAPDTVWLRPADSREAHAFYQAEVAARLEPAEPVVWCGRYLLEELQEDDQAERCRVCQLAVAAQGAGPARGTSAPQGQVEVGRQLMRFHRRIPEFVSRVVPGQVQPAEWYGLAVALEALAAACRQQDTVIDPDESPPETRR